MKKVGIAVAFSAWLLLIGTRVLAHQLDEYLQAATISVEKGRILTQLRLTPGVAVFPAVMALIDTNADGVISETEKRAYAEKVLRDLSLTANGDRLRLHLVSWRFAEVKEMEEGLGDIDIAFDARVTQSGGRNRRLTFENHHQSRIAAYMVNCLVPSDGDIQITAQNRSYQQSSYQMDYVQTGGGVVSSHLPPQRWTGVWEWLSAGGIALVLFSANALRRRKRSLNCSATGLALPGRQGV